MKTLSCNLFEREKLNILRTSHVYFNSFMYAAWANIVYRVGSSLKRNFCTLAIYVDYHITGLIFNLTSDIGIFF